ncbi:MAG TPA: peptidyl-prolyl cis-trans isomerase [Novosphingobium sp.]|nr:peptidyl-prolyl cis-trans isomerase [Novosphingobium sp.]
MLQFFRSFFSSKVGVGVTLAIVGIIGLSFALGDVSSSGSFGGVSGGDRAALVGGKRIGTAALSQAATAALDDARQKDPRATMQALIAQGGLSDVLEQLIDRAAIAAFGESHGIVAGSRLVDSEIAKIGAFRGVDGNFSEDAYRQVLQQRGLNDGQVREDIGSGLIARQILVPAAFGAKFPRDMALRYAALLREHRIGAIALLPSAAFAPKTPPSDAEIKTYYDNHRNAYLRPERRVIRFASFDESALKNVAAPTDAEIAARYSANRAQYAASETRQITQLILPTEAGARAVLAEVAGGKSLEAAATAKGLSTAKLDKLAKPALLTQSSQAVADATFATAKGKIAGPLKSSLGWHLMRIDGIEAKPARTLDEVRGELTTALAAEKRRTALTDFSARIEEEFDNGGTLADVAKELGLTISQTQPLTADGAVYGKPGEQAPEVLKLIIQTAFAMDSEGQAQLAEIVAGKTFLVFDVGSIAVSAPAPLAEIKAGVAGDLALQKGSVAARAAADKVLAAARKGTDLGAAMTAIGVAMPPVDRVDMGRQELAANGQQVPAPLALLFSMAEGTVKLLPGPRNRGYYVVSLKDIVPGTVAANDPVIAAAQRELGQLTAREYAEALRRAIRAEVGVSRNETAIGAVSRQLTGGN